MATSLSKSEGLVILSVRKYLLTRKVSGFAAGCFIKFGRASPQTMPHTGHKILSKISRVSTLDRADVQHRRFAGYFNADCQCSRSLAWATKI
jgi:hypothetical protein